jgi:hypothetical protein
MDVKRLFGLDSNNFHFIWRGKSIVAAWTLALYPTQSFQCVRYAKTINLRMIFRGKNWHLSLTKKETLFKWALLRSDRYRLRIIWVKEVSFSFHISMLHMQRRHFIHLKKTINLLDYLWSRNTESKISIKMSTCFSCRIKHGLSRIVLSPHPPTSTPIEQNCRWKHLSRCFGG